MKPRTKQNKIHRLDSQILRITWNKIQCTKVAEHLVQWVPKNICYDGVLEIFWKTDFRYSLPFKVDPVESTTNIPLDSPQKRQSIPAAPTIKFHGPDVIKTMK